MEIAKPKIAFRYNCVSHTIVCFISLMDVATYKKNTNGYLKTCLSVDISIRTKLWTILYYKSRDNNITVISYRRIGKTVNYCFNELIN